MNRISSSRRKSSTRRFSRTSACVLACLGLVFATGCQNEVPDGSSEKSKSEKSPVVKTTEPETQKTKPPVKTKKTVVAKKKTEPKKKDVVLTGRQKARIDAVLRLLSDDVILTLTGGDKPVELNDAKKLDELLEDPTKNITKVDFTSAAADITAEHFELLQNFPELRFINATGCRTVGDEAIKHLKDHTRITNLILFGTDVGNVGLETIGRMDRLINLCLDQTTITDAGLKHLTNLPEIYLLHVRSRNKISDVGVSDLLKMKSLRELKVGGTQITGAGVAKLKRLLPRCKVKIDAVENPIESP